MRIFNFLSSAPADGNAPPTGGQSGRSVRLRHGFATALAVLLGASSGSALAADKPSMRTTQATSSTSAPQAAPSPTSAPWFPTQALKGSRSGNQPDWFGRNVAIDGTMAIIGAPTSRTTGTARKGGAYLYALEGDTWVEKHFLSGSQQTSGTSVDNYGWSVALQGDTAVVAAITVDYVNYFRGMAYVYAKVGETWTEQSILMPSETTVFDDFGRAIALDGDTLVIGAPADRPTPDAYGTGAAYVYVRNAGSWSLQAKLMADDAEMWMAFGASVAVDGDTILVGATGNSDFPRPGTVYAYTRSGGSWTLTQKIHEASAVDNDFFGTSVALQGDTAIIGASGAEPGGEFVRGAAYVMQRSAGIWQQQQTLIASDGAAFDQFGNTLAMHGDYALIGSPTATRNHDEEGLAYLFVRDANGWTEAKRLTSSLPQRSETFGFGLAVSDEFAFVGAPFGNGASKTSAVYVFRNTDRAHLQFDPEQLAMGVTPVGYSSDPIAATLVNDGRSAAQVSSITVPAGPFSLDSTTCGDLPFTLQAESTCELRFRFTPAAVQTYTAKVDVHSDALVSQVSLTLNATGVAATANLAAVNPTAIAADVVAGASSSSSISLHNSGTASLGWSVFDSPGDESLIVHLDHSASSTVVPGVTLACGSFFATRETHYLRTFSAADFGVTGAFHVDQVEFAIERATVNTDVRVRLHRLDGVMSFQNLSLLSESTVSIAPQEIGMITVPVDVDLPANATLVVELVAPNLEDIGGTFHPGSNQAGETSPSWYAAPSCGYPQPVRYSSIPGFPSPVVHLVMSATGHAIDCEVPQWLEADPASGSVPAQGAGTFTASLDSAGLAAGTYQAKICLASNATNRPLAKVPVTLAVREAIVGLEVSPDHLDFGSVDVGLGSAAQAVTLSNTGNTMVTITGVAAAATPFHKQPGTCPEPPFALAPEQSCSLSYAFSPLVDGSASQSLILSTSAGERSITLSGVGVTIPRALSVLSGSGQETTVATPFPLPLAVQVRDALGRPMAGVALTFVAPATGPGAILSSGSATTDGNGYASVTAVATEQVGSYVVQAFVDGIAQPAAFALSNRAVAADVSVVIRTNNEFTRAGGLVDYWITLGNNGPDAARSVNVAMLLPPQLDADATRWICLESAPNVCEANGTGALSDNVTLAAGQSISWLVTAPVRSDAEEADIHTSVQATFPGDPIPANNASSVITQMVLFRDGFEPYGTGSAIEPSPSAPRWDVSNVARLEWNRAEPTAGVELLVEANEIRSPGSHGRFRIERLATEDSQWLRLVGIGRDGALTPGAWQAMPAMDSLWIATEPSDPTDVSQPGWLIVLGATDVPVWERAWPDMGAAYSFRLSGTASLTVVAPTSE